MLGIFASIGVVLCIIVIAGLYLKVWKNKTYSVTKKVFLSLIVLVFMVVLAYSLFFLVLINSDHASYYTTGGKNFGNVNYRQIMENAEEADYEINGPFFVNVRPQDSTGIHPNNIPELEKHLGDEYLLKFATYYYNKDTVMELMFTDEDRTSITFFNYSRPDPHFSPFKVEHLPSDNWIIDKMVLVFGFDKQRSINHIQAMKAGIEEGERPKMEISSPVSTHLLYNDMEEMSTSSNFSLTRGEGSTTLLFYNNEELVGRINCVVPNHRIVHRTENGIYSVKIDKLGGVDLSLELDSGESIPEEKYIGVFKEMFNNIGLPESYVDEFEFDYSPSVW